MTSISRMQNVCVCFAVDDNYAPYLRVTLFSMLKNRNKDLKYDIFILYSDLNEDNISRITSFSENNEGVNIRFLDISTAIDNLNYDTCSYLSAATLYRLLILSDIFSEYKKMIYLDSDIIVNADISELFASDMGDCPVAAVEELGFRQLSYSKKAVFIDGRYPYNINNYKTDALKMQCPENYFNAGVMLFDLEKCRGRYNYQQAVDILKSKKYYYNDQDVLNIMFDGQVKMLDFTWNYQNCIEMFCERFPDIYGPIYADVRCSSPKIIHYVSSHKPWNCSVALESVYHEYEKQVTAGDNGI